MARRSGMMTALQAALAGFSGGIEGRMQQRAADEEKSRVAAALERQARMDTAAAERQSMLDQIALGEKGFVERGVREERAKAAAPALGSMVSTALSSLSSFGMGGGPAGVLPDMSTVQKAAGTYRNAPAQSFNVGGKTYEQMQTKQERDAMEMAQDEEAKARQLQQAERVKATEAQRVAALKAEERQAQIAQYESLGYNKKDATMLVDNASAFTAMRGQDISAATARGQLKVAQDRLAITKGKAQEATEEVQNFYDNERKIIAEFMPTKVVGKDGKVQYKAPAVTPTQASMMATKSDWTNWWASEDAQRYTSSVKRISDSFAVAKEGRGASNADKESYLNAVMVRPGEFKNYKLMDDKWKRLQSYISFLESKDKKNVSNRQAAGTDTRSALDELEGM